MGGCCCGTAGSFESDRAPRRQNLEEQEPLSSNFNGASLASTTVAVDTNLDTSTPDTYRPPPAPLPFNVGLTVSDSSDLEKSGVKSKADEQQSMKMEYESCQKGAHEDEPDEEEDVCPICLEEYDEENPSSVTRCRHNFHLCCILEWLERSDACPVCDQVALIDGVHE